MGDGLEVLKRNFHIPAQVLKEGSNTFSINMPADLGIAADVVHLESFAVEYQAAIKAENENFQFKGRGSHFRVRHLASPSPLVYAVTQDNVYHLSTIQIFEDKGNGLQAILPHPNPSAGVATFFLSQSHQLLHADLSPSHREVDILNHQADYLIIAHPNFMSSLGPLVQAKTNQGFQVFITDTEQIYGEFSHNQVDAQAIADYIAYAKRNMGTQYVLLVGGDSYDYKNYLNIGSMSFVPTKYVRTGNLVTFAPSDAALADTTGDGFPDIAIGRLPVRTAEELQTIIAKTLKFGQSQYENLGLFAAGSDESSISFTGFSQHLQSLTPLDWTSEEAYIDVLGVSGAKTKIIDTVNQGISFLNFFGHSGPTVWTFENLFSAQDASQLQNAHAPTVVTQWGCWNTYFVAPTYNTMAHKFLLSGPQGAAAVIGASTLTSVSSEKQFAPIFFKELFRKGQSLGQALLNAKQLTKESYPELKDIYFGIHLLGDPSLILNP